MDKSLLAKMLSGRVVIACIGNEMRGDDGVGPFIAGLLTPSERVKVVDCGETPENQYSWYSKASATQGQVNRAELGQ